MLNLRVRPRAFQFIIIFLIFFSLSFQAQAQTVENKILDALERRVERSRLRDLRGKKKKKKVRSVWRESTEFRFSGDILAYSTSYQNNPQENLYNPGNQVFKWPSNTLGADASLDMRLLISDFQFVLRPRWQYSQSEIQLQNPTSSVKIDENKLSLLETYADWRSGNLSLNAGMQKYSWGPAEIMNPSNFIFHFEKDENGQTYRPKGRTLIRANWQASSSSNLILISEVAGNGEPSWLYNHDFQMAGLAKYELVSTDNSLNYLGLIAGKSQESSQDLGAYFNLSWNNGISIYAETRSASEAMTYRPDSSTPTRLTLQKSKSATAISVVGLRWETELDIRLEYLSNGFGYSEREVSQVLSSLSVINPYFADNLKKFSASGLELPLQDYLYLSLRKDERGTDISWAFFFRDFYSMNENIHYLQFGADYEIFSNVIVSFEGGYLTPRREDSLLSQMISDNIGLGARLYF